MKKQVDVTIAIQKTFEELDRYKKAYIEMRNILNPEQWNKIRKSMKALGFGYHFTPKL